jgi:hypothetical protein
MTGLNLSEFEMLEGGPGSYQAQLALHRPSRLSKLQLTKTRESGHHGVKRDSPDFSLPSGNL